MNLRFPASLKFTVPLILLAFAATLSTVNMLYHVPRAQRAAEDDSRKRLAQEMSRLQSTLEYLLLKGEVDVAQHEIEVLAHNHDVILAALTDDRQAVVVATKRAWLGRQIAEVLPQFDLAQAAGAIRERRAELTIDPNGRVLRGYAGVLMGGEREELRPSRIGSLFLAYDLERYKAEARAQVLQQSLYWAGWVTALALAMWLVFHFLLTRRTALLVRAAEDLAAGKLSARSGLKGTDELGRLGRAFDAMALEVAETQTRLRQDIAERARVQEQLENSEARLQQILNNATAVIYVKDTEGRILFVNKQWERLFHVPQADAVGKTEREMLPKAIAQAFRRNDLLVLERNEPMEFEETAPLDDGVHTYISIKFPLYDATGTAYAVCGISTDITERKRSDEAVRVSEASYRAIFDAAEDAFFVTDLETAAIVDANPKACATLGYTREELQGVKVGMLSSGEPPYTQPEAMRQFARAVAGEQIHLEWQGKRKDGSLPWFEVFAKRMAIGGQDRILVLARDITEKKRAAEELARQRESLHQREKLAALGSLLAGVAHELNNPLSVVVARAVLLEEQGDSATQVAAQKIRTAAERCARIVRTFLAMARQQQPERGPVAINDVVSAALDIAAYPIRTSSIELTQDLSEHIPPILADADQLHQVMLNLIINAQQSLQERPAPRRLHVTTCFDSFVRVVRINVADNGPGIPEHLRARIFEPYFTTKPMGTGTGVGLAVSLGIVEAHGGTLTVTCPVEGGAVFTILLPVGPVNAASPDTERLAKASAGQRSILIVDDEAEIRETLSEILTSECHRVVAVGSGREALERMAAEQFDVILTDMRMPDIDGRELYRQIKERWPDQAKRVVFVTGDTLASALRDFVAKSGRLVIEKPFVPSDVRRVVDELAAGGDHAAAA
jgi:PAS domain S-box-containing protein